RRSNRSLTAPPISKQAIVGAVIAIPITDSAAGAFHSAYAVHAVATRNIPSPTSETLIPIHSRRKSRVRSGLKRPTRATPPALSSPSKLCCIGLERAANVFGREVLVERARR